MEELICITCPKGCTLTVDVRDHQIVSVTGNSCPRGIQYAEHEILHPVRMITSTVKISGASIGRCPVMTSKPVAKELMFDVMKQIEQLSIEAPVTCGQVLMESLCGQDVQLVATRTMKKIKE